MARLAQPNGLLGTQALFPVTICQRVLTPDGQLTTDTLRTVSLATRESSHPTKDNILEGWVTRSVYERCFPSSFESRHAFFALFPDFPTSFSTCAIAAFSNIDQSYCVHTSESWLPAGARQARTGPASQREGQKEAKGGKRGDEATRQQAVRGSCRDEKEGNRCGCRKVHMHSRGRTRHIYAGWNRGRAFTALSRAARHASPGSGREDCGTVGEKSGQSRSAGSIRSPVPKKRCVGVDVGWAGVGQGRRPCRGGGARRSSVTGKKLNAGAEVVANEGP